MLPPVRRARQRGMLRESWRCLRGNGMVGSNFVRDALASAAAVAAS
jgi:hypothetical protein